MRLFSEDDCTNYICMNVCISQLLPYEIHFMDLVDIEFGRSDQINFQANFLCI